MTEEVTTSDQHTQGHVPQPADVIPTSEGTAPKATPAAAGGTRKHRSADASKRVRRPFVDLAPTTAPGGASLAPYLQSINEMLLKDNCCIDSDLESLCAALIGRMVGSLVSVGLASPPPPVAVRLVAPNRSNPPVAACTLAVASSSHPEVPSPQSIDPDVEPERATRGTSIPRGKAKSLSRTANAHSLKSILALDHRTGSRKLDALFAGTESESRPGAGYFANDYILVLRRCLRWLATHALKKGLPLSATMLGDLAGRNTLEGQARVSVVTVNDAPQGSPQPTTAVADRSLKEWSILTDVSAVSPPDKKPTEATIARQLFPSNTATSLPVFIRVDVSHCFATPQQEDKGKPEALGDAPASPKPSPSATAEYDAVCSIVAVLLSVPSFIAGRQPLPTDDITPPTRKEKGPVRPVVEVDLVFRDGAVEAPLFDPLPATALAEALLGQGQREASSAPIGGQLSPDPPTAPPRPSPHLGADAPRKQIPQHEEHGDHGSGPPPVRGSLSSPLMDDTQTPKGSIMVRSQHERRNTQVSTVDGASCDLDALVLPLGGTTPHVAAGGAGADNSNNQSVTVTGFHRRPSTLMRNPQTPHRQAGADVEDSSLDDTNGSSQAPEDEAVAINNALLPLAEGCVMPDPFPADLISSIRERQTKLIQKSLRRSRAASQREPSKAASKRTNGSSSKPTSQNSGSRATSNILGIGDDSSLADSTTTSDEDEDEGSDSGRGEFGRSCKSMPESSVGTLLSNSASFGRNPGTLSRRLRKRARVVDQWRTMLARRDAHGIREDTHFSQNRDAIYALVGDLREREPIGPKEVVVDSDRLKLAEVLYGQRYVREYCLGVLQQTMEAVESNCSSTTPSVHWFSGRSSAKTGSEAGEAMSKDPSTIGRAGFKVINSTLSGSGGGTPAHHDRRGSMMSADSDRGKGIGRRGRVSISITPGAAGYPPMAEHPTDALDTPSDGSTSDSLLGRGVIAKNPPPNPIVTVHGGPLEANSLSTNSSQSPTERGPNDGTHPTPPLPPSQHANTPTTTQRGRLNVVRLPPAGEDELQHPPRPSPLASTGPNSSFAFSTLNLDATANGHSFSSAVETPGRNHTPNPDHRQIALSEVETDENQLSNMHRSFSVVATGGLMRRTREKPTALIHIEKKRSVASKSNPNDVSISRSTVPTTSMADPPLALMSVMSDDDRFRDFSPDAFGMASLPNSSPRGGSPAFVSPMSAISPTLQSPAQLPPAVLAALTTKEDMTNPYATIPLVEEEGGSQGSSSSSESGEPLGASRITPATATESPNLADNSPPPPLTAFKPPSNATATTARDANNASHLAASITSLASKRRITRDALERTPSLSILRHLQSRDVLTRDQNPASPNTSVNKFPTSAMMSFSDSISKSVSPSHGIGMMFPSPGLAPLSPNPQHIRNTSMSTSGTYRRPSVVTTTSYLKYLYGDLAPLVEARLHTDFCCATSVAGAPSDEGTTAGSQSTTTGGTSGLQPLSPRERALIDKQMIDMATGESLGGSSYLQMESGSIRPEAAPNTPHAPIVAMFSFNPASAPKRHQLTHPNQYRFMTPGSPKSDSLSMSKVSDATAPYNDEGIYSPTKPNETISGFEIDQVSGEPAGDAPSPPLVKHLSDTSNASAGRSSVSSHTSITYGARVQTIASSGSPRPRGHSELSGPVMESSVASTSSMGFLDTLLGTAPNNNGGVPPKLPINFNPHILPLSNAFRDDDMVSTYSICPEQRKDTKHTEQLVKQEDDDEGYMMVNDYILLELKGEGQYGEVHLVVDNSPEAIAKQQEECLEDHELYRAMKIIAKNKLRRRYGGNDKATAALEKEIAVMKRLHHRNIVSLDEVINDPNDPFIYLVMPYIDRGPVIHIDPATGCYGPPLLHITQIRKYIRQVTAALVYLHRQGVCHMDLKPDNMLLGTTRKRRGDISSGGIVGLSSTQTPDDEDDTTLYLSDFGVSEIFAADEEEADDDHHTLTAEEEEHRAQDGGNAAPKKMILRSTDGTPAYVAPEALTGEPFNAMPIDMWALGVTIYLFLFGFHPFTGASIPMLFDSIRENKPHYSLPQADEAEERVHYNMNIDRDVHDEPPMSEVAFQAQRKADQKARLDCVDLIQKLLETNPQKRLTAVQCRHHRFLSKSTGFQFRQPQPQVEMAEVAPGTPPQTAEPSVTPSAADGGFATPSAPASPREGEAARRTSTTSTASSMSPPRPTPSQDGGGMWRIRMAYMQSLKHQQQQQQEERDGQHPPSQGSVHSISINLSPSSSLVVQQQQQRVSAPSLATDFKFPMDQNPLEHSDSISSVDTDDSLGTMEKKVALKNQQAIRRAEREARRREDKLAAKRLAAANAASSSSGGDVTNAGAALSIGDVAHEVSPGSSRSTQGSVGSRPAGGSMFSASATPHRSSQSPKGGKGGSGGQHSGSFSSTASNPSGSPNQTKNPRDGSVFITLSFRNKVRPTDSVSGRPRENSASSAASGASVGTSVGGSSINQRFMFGGGSTAGMAESMLGRQGPSGLLKRRRRQMATPSSRPSVAMESSLGGGLGVDSAPPIRSSFASPTLVPQPRVVSGSAAAAVRAANHRQRNQGGSKGSIQTINMSVLNTFGGNPHTGGAPVVRPSTANPTESSQSMAGAPAVGLRPARVGGAHPSKHTHEEEAALAMHLT